MGKGQLSAKIDDKVLNRFRVFCAAQGLKQGDVIEAGLKGVMDDHPVWDEILEMAGGTKKLLDPSVTLAGDDAARGKVPRCSASLVDVLAHHFLAGVNMRKTEYTKVQIEGFIDLAGKVEGEIEAHYNGWLEYGYLEEQDYKDKVPTPEQCAFKLFDNIEVAVMRNMAPWLAVDDPEFNKRRFISDTCKLIAHLTVSAFYVKPFSCTITAGGMMAGIVDTWSVDFWSSKNGTLPTVRCGGPEYTTQMILNLGSIRSFIKDLAREND